MPTELNWLDNPDELPPEHRIAIERYWARQPDDSGFMGTAAQAAAAGGLKSITLNQLVRAWSTLLVHDARCSGCGDALEAHTRSEHAELVRAAAAGRPQRCEACETYARERAAQDARELDERRQADLRARWDGWTLAGQVGVPTTPDALTLRQSVLLLALSRSSAHETMAYFMPVATRDLALAPGELQHTLLSELWEERLIGTHPGGTLAAFTWEGERATSVTLDRAHLVLAMGPRGGSFAEIMEVIEARLRDPDASFGQGWADELQTLKDELFDAEAQLALLTQLRTHRLGPFSVGEKTRLVMRKLRRHYSLGQTWKIIAYSVEKAAAAAARGTPRAVATNGVITRIDGYIDRALAEGWSVQAYRRDRNHPPSAVALVTWELAGQESVFDADQTVLTDPDAGA